MEIVTFEVSIVVAGVGEGASDSVVRGYPDPAQGLTAGIHFEVVVPRKPGRPAPNMVRPRLVCYEDSTHPTTTQFAESWPPQLGSAAVRVDWRADMIRREIVVRGLFRWRCRGITVWRYLARWKLT